MRKETSSLASTVPSYPYEEQGLRFETPTCNWLPGNALSLNANGVDVSDYSTLIAEAQNRHIIPSPSGCSTGPGSSLSKKKSITFSNFYGMPVTLCLIPATGENRTVCLPNVFGSNLTKDDPIDHGGVRSIKLSPECFNCIIKGNVGNVSQNGNVSLAQAGGKKAIVSILGGQLDVSVDDNSDEDPQALFLEIQNTTDVNLETGLSTVNSGNFDQEAYARALATGFDKPTGLISAKTIAPGQYHVVTVPSIGYHLWVLRQATDLCKRQISNRSTTINYNTTDYIQVASATVPIGSSVVLLRGDKNSGVLSVRDGVMAITVPSAIVEARGTIRF